MNESMNVTQMYWQPKLIFLHQVGCPDIGDGQPTPLYVNPQLIKSIRIVVHSFVTINTSLKEKKEFHQGQLGTEVFCEGFSCVVIEPPEFVAMLRNKALGHPVPKITSV